jgi:hypothetical protein
MQLVQLLSALLTPVIAVVTTYIALQQYRTNRFKFKLEMFEKRNAVYQGVKDFIHSAVRKTNLSTDDFIKLDEATQDAFFLFDEPVDKYINELRWKASKLNFMNEKIAEQILHPYEELSQVEAERDGICVWFGKQHSESKEVFKKYLRVSL